LQQACLILGIILAVFQQWCGINVIFNYAAEAVEAIGAERKWIVKFVSINNYKTARLHNCINARLIKS